MKELVPALTILLMVFIANLAFWGGVIYVAAHFIGKFW